MIGIDTNILVRYLTRDDPEGFAQARQLLEDECSASRPAYINLVVLTETVWVLDRAYNIKKADILRVLELLSSTRQIQLEASDSIRDAMALFRDSAIEFADCLIASHNRSAECRTTMTFDRKAASIPGFQLL